MPTIQEQLEALEAQRAELLAQQAKQQEDKKLDDLAKALGVERGQIKLDGNEYVVNKVYTQEQAAAYQDALGETKKNPSDRWDRPVDDATLTPLGADDSHAKLRIPKENLAHIDDTELANVSDVTNHYKNKAIAERLEAERHTSEDRNKADQIADAMGIERNNVTVKDGHAIINNLPLEQARALTADINTDQLVPNAVINNTGNNSATLDINLRNIGDAHINAVRTTIAEQKQQVDELKNALGSPEIIQENGKVVIDGHYSKLEAEKIVSKLNNDGYILNGDPNSHIARDNDGSYKIVIDNIKEAHSHRESASQVYMDEIHTDYQKRISQEKELAALKARQQAEPASTVAQTPTPEGESKAASPAAAPESQTQPAQAPAGTPATERAATETAPVTAAPAAAQANMGIPNTPELTVFSFGKDADGKPNATVENGKVVLTKPLSKEAIDKLSRETLENITTESVGGDKYKVTIIDTDKLSKGHAGPENDIKPALAEQAKIDQQEATTRGMLAEATNEAPKEGNTKAATAPVTAETTSVETKSITMYAGESPQGREERITDAYKDLEKAGKELEKAEKPLHKITTAKEGYDGLKQDEKEHTHFDKNTWLLQDGQKAIDFNKLAKEDHDHFVSGKIGKEGLTVVQSAQDVMFNAATEHGLQPGRYEIDFKKQDGKEGNVGFVVPNNAALKIEKQQDGVVVTIGEGEKAVIVNVKGATEQDIKTTQVNEKWNHQGLASADKIENKARAIDGENIAKVGGAAQKVEEKAKALAASVDSDGDGRINKDEALQAKATLGKLNIDNAQIMAIGEVLKGAGMKFDNEALTVFKPAETPAVAQAAGQEQTARR